MNKAADNKAFVWRNWKLGQLPRLELHSEKKLELLHDYLVLYLKIVLKNTSGKEVQEITLIDGFAGGGVYQDRRIGSPLTILKAVQEAEALLSIGRSKPTKIIPICYFIEENADAYACLDASLRANGYEDKIGKTIHLRQSRFDDCVEEIVSNINSRHKRGGNRTIFFLDQCGYTEISASTIKRIAEQLNNRPEFIINFAIDWLMSFISERRIDQVDASLKKFGLENHVDTRSMLKLHMELGGKWEHVVESYIGQGFHKATGIEYFSPFYIEPKDNHLGYWLLHLAQSARARSAMTEIHWSKANRSKHYGYPGYDMLSYKPDLDKTKFMDGMSFDDESRKLCQTVLTNDFARLLRNKHENGISFKDFIEETSNNVMADAPMLHDVMWQLCDSDNFEVVCPSGVEKRTRKFSEGDIIKPRAQLIFPGVGIGVPPQSCQKIQTNPLVRAS